jgi:hypothetical protein
MCKLTNKGAIKNQEIIKRIQKYDFTGYRSMVFISKSH